MIKILTVFGTRPEVIKMAPIIREFQKHPKKIQCQVCLTGQHKEMVTPLLKIFDIHVDQDIHIMKHNQTLKHITASVLESITGILQKKKPDYLMIQGDTTTTMAASLAAFYEKVKIAHVEAGLRTWDHMNPYPEEVNRRIIDCMADLYFAHTPAARQNLLKEGIHKNKIEVTGNTVIDALFDVVKRNSRLTPDIVKLIPPGSQKMILVTSHRRESFGQPLINTCTAVAKIATMYPDMLIVYPVHLNPHVQTTVYKLLGNIKNVILTKPQDYLSFVYLMKRSYLILTDSGGVQEEAPSLGKPVLVLRETTERPEAVDAGVVKIIGTNTKKIIASTKLLIEDKAEYKRMSRAMNPYGDGHAAKRIVARFLKERA